MSDIRETIKNKLLEKIRDASDPDKTYKAVVAFREFVLALRTEADIKLVEKEVER